MFLYGKISLGTSGSIEVVVASDQAVKISGVKDGFQRAFAHVITRGLGAPSSDRLVPPQPKGFENAIKVSMSQSDGDENFSAK